MGIDVGGRILRIRKKERKKLKDWIWRKLSYSLLCNSACKFVVSNTRGPKSQASNSTYGTTKVNIFREYASLMHESSVFWPLLNHEKSFPYKIWPVIKSENDI
ncbi:hypothetical protein LOAG_00185 [Loa loa]|uniref:Uncharacterized protein n=1 Tax=Loa loa TaxID=7209 RepID=A0A1S0UC11_LOALO|nr:hypothetical protein LOAG_00185 [Loa loa]EFO28292.1 hypothetical protein LOAG_00185 [Loa loa]